MEAPRRSLRPLLDPDSVAIIGASSDLNRISGRPLKYLLQFGYKGRILPVNPKYAEVAGIPCYPSIDAIPGDIDLAIVSLPAETAVGVLSACARRGVGSAVVFSSGFAEMGEQGKVLQSQIGALARETGMLICGPNSLGIANLGLGMTASFSQTLERRPPAGPAAFVTQSGAFGTFLFGMALENGLAFKYFVSSGNEADVEFSDYVDYLVDDPEVRVIAGYIEGLKSGRKLVHAARRAAAVGKPIVVVKVGRSSAGTRAARSHTGSMTGSDDVYSAAFEQLGIVRADTEEQLLDYVATFLHKGNIPRGRGVGIVTQSGGAGVLASDRCEQTGLTVPELTEESRKALAGVVPAFGATGNPVDITAQFIAEPTLLRDSVSLVDKDPGIGATMFCLGLMDLFWKKVLSELKGLHETMEKPLFVSWTAAPQEALSALRAEGIPVFPTPTRTVDAIAAAASFAARSGRPAGGGLWSEERSPLPVEAERLIQAARSEGRDHLLEYEAKALLDSFGVPVPPGGMADSPEQALEVARTIGYPVVLKAQAVGLLHKSEARVIELDVRDEERLRAAFARVTGNAREHCAPGAMRGVLVEEMVRGGTETIAGLSYDPLFGPVLLFGLGGIFTEVLRDVALGLCPLDAGGAEALIRRVKGFPVLAGARGRPKTDLAALAGALVGVSRMALALEGVAAEMDINPLLVLPEGQGVRAADALITLK